MKLTDAPLPSTPAALEELLQRDPHLNMDSLRHFHVLHVDVTDHLLGITTAYPVASVLRAKVSPDGWAEVDVHGEQGTCKVHGSVRLHVCRDWFRRHQDEASSDRITHAAALDPLAAAPRGPQPSFARDVLALVAKRGATYGSPAENHQLTADLLNAWLRRRMRYSPGGTAPGELTAEDVCVVNILQKLSRLANGTHDDSWRDVIGYAENVALLDEEQRNRRSSR